MVWEGKSKNYWVTLQKKSSNCLMWLEHSRDYVSGVKVLCNKVRWFIKWDLTLLWDRLLTDLFESFLIPTLSRLYFLLYFIFIWVWILGYPYRVKFKPKMIISLILREKYFWGVLTFFMEFYYLIKNFWYSPFHDDITLKRILCWMMICLSIVVPVWYKSVIITIIFINRLFVSCVLCNCLQLDEILIV